MKIAYLINQYPQPSQSFIRREIVALEKLGVEVDRFTLRRWDQKLVDDADISEQQRMRVVLGMGPVGLLLALLRSVFVRPGKLLQTIKLACKVGRRSERGILVHLVYVLEACVLIRWLRNGQVSHVHAHFGTNSTTVAMLCHALGGPAFSFTVHGPEEFDKPLFLGLPEKIARAKFVVAISQFGRSQLYRWCKPSEWSKIHIVRCGVDEVFLSIPPTPITSAPRLVCVGRLAPQKGQLLLVRAVAQLKMEGVPCELILVGDGVMRPEIQLLIDQDGLDSHVKMVGWKSNPQVREEVLNSRAMVLPSFAEGLPVVIMEALALGRPVITTRIAGIPELVEHGVTGWILTPGSVDELVTALREVLAAPESKLEEMGRNGAQRVRQQHDVNIEARKLAALLGAGVQS
jgi:colanic acid/amylovoran biosynthesis glycosyltransferase